MFSFCCAFSSAEDEEWACESCGSVNTTNYCLHCGARKPAVIVCSECGNIYPSDTEALFCGNCGTKLRKEGKTIVESTPSNNILDNNTEFGMWTIRHYVDEFKNPTARKYITNTVLINGKFSNGATNDSNLTVKILIDTSDISIMLYEYGKYQVKTYSSSGDKYAVSVLDNDGSKHKLKGSMYSDRISIESGYEDELLSIFADEGKVVFSITDERYTVNQYTFTINNTADFISAYRTLAGKELTSWHQKAMAVEKENERKAREKEEEREKYKGIIGHTVLFGSYEQDNNLGNGKEPIEWIILKVDNERAYLLSRYALDNGAYKKGKKVYLWEQSELRRWLNETFYNNAFSEDEKILLVEMEVYDYKDMVTVFSTDETWQYNPEILLCKPSQYTLENNTVNVNTSGNCTWVLRNVAISKEVGVINGEGKRDYKNQNDLYAIRPVICVGVDYLLKSNSLSEQAIVNNIELFTFPY